MTAAYRASLALLLLLAACGDDKEKAIFVANTDTDRPTDRDTSTGSADTSLDSSTDPVDTTGDDTGSGADTDLTDSGSGDTATDTDLADTTPDTVADTTTDTVADTTADTAADTAVDTRPEPPVVWTPTETPTPPAGVGIKTFTCPQRDPTSTFYITEMQINPNNAEGRGTATEWFEVINMGATPFNLNGVRVADAGTDQFTVGEAPPAGVFGGDAICATLTEVGAFFDVPTDTTIDPYEFFTFYQQTQIDAVCAADPSCKPYVGLHYYVFDRCFMAIANAGDEIILYDNRGRVLDCVEYGASADVESQSLQRLYRGGTWTDDWCVTAQDEALRYNSNAEVSATPVPGDYGTPGLPPRCVE
jgi:hypothetical protein